MFSIRVAGAGLTKPQSGLAEGDSGSGVGTGLLRRRQAALNGLPARIVGAGATPGRRGRGGRRVRAL